LSDCGNGNSISTIEGDDVKMSNFYLTTQGEACFENLETYFGNSFDEAFNRLLHSETLADVIEAIEIAKEKIGHIEYVNAVILYHIHSNKLWKNLGYPTLNAFIQDLVKYSIGTRQTFYNAVYVGAVLKNPCFSFNKKLTFDTLARNYSKLRLFWPLFSIKSRDAQYRLSEVIDEVFEHFLNDTYVKFKLFMEGVKPHITAEEKSKQSKEVSQLKEQSIKVKVPEILEGTSREIYSIIQAGLKVWLEPNIDPEFCRSINIYLEALREKDYKKLNNRESEEQKEYLSKTGFAYLEHLGDLADMFFIHNIRYNGGPGGMITPDAVKKFLQRNLKNKTDLEIVEAYLVYRVNTDKQLLSQLSNYGASNACDFAMKYLDISLSQYKRLKRIGENLELFRFLNGELNISGVTILEKIYFLDKALKNHDKDSVVNGFNVLTAKQLSLS
jgi:hypothetical protein